MKLEDLLAALEKGEVDTPVTPLNPTEVAAKAAPDRTYTPVTPITRQKSNMREEAGKPAGVMYETTSRSWRFHYSNREPKEASYWPPVSEAEALEGESDAISAEPFEPARQQPDEPLSEDEEIEFHEWLAEKGEAMIREALEECRTDEERDAILRMTGKKNNGEGH